jgi:hypothetical protein
MSPSVFESGAVHYDHRIFLNSGFSKHALRCTRKRTLFHSVKDLRHATLSIMKQSLKAKSRP